MVGANALRRSLAAAFVLALLTGATAAAEFQFDIPLNEYREKIGKFVIADLVVGEEGIAISSPLCLQGNTFKVEGLTVLSTDSPTGGSINVKRLPGGELDITITPAKDASRSAEERLETAVFYATASPCNPSVGADDVYFSVKSINGKMALSETARPRWGIVGLQRLVLNIGAAAKSATPSSVESGD